MGYDRNDCWMTCGERDDKCAEMGLMDGPLTKDPFAEIERLRAALINLYDYCEDHDWGTIPVGKTIEGAEDLVRELRVNEQNARDEKQPVEQLGYTTLDPMENSN